MKKEALLFQKQETQPLEAKGAQPPLKRGYHYFKSEKHVWHSRSHEYKAMTTFLACLVHMKMNHQTISQLQRASYISGKTITIRMKAMN
jgi:hypothetical protein